MKMCRLVISHIGGNLPCMAAPGPTAKSYDNIEINYAANGGTANACGEAADITFYVRIQKTKLDRLSSWSPSLAGPVQLW